MRTTVDKIAQRFHSMLEQLFNITDVQMKKPIYELSLILPDERLLNAINEQYTSVVSFCLLYSS